MNSSIGLNNTIPPGWQKWTRFNPPVLQNNLDVLEKHHPELFHIVQPILQNSSYYLRLGERQVIECAFHAEEEFKILLSSDRLKQDWPSITAAINTFSPSTNATVIFYLGCDLGNTYNIVHQHLNQSPHKALVWLESDPVFFALTLASFSLERMLQSNRCFIIIGEDWHSQLEEIFDAQNFFTIDRPDIFLSATARFTNRLSIWQPLKNYITSWMRNGRESYAEALQSIRQYYATKPPERIKSIMALHLSEQDGKAIPYIQQRFLDECKRLGIDIIYHHPGFRSDVSFIRTIQKEQPDLLLFINKSPDEYTDRKILDSLRLPRLIWCLDDPNCFVKENFGPNDFVFTWDKWYTKNLQDMQARSVDFFPYVADLDKVDATFQERFRSPVSYIGQVKAFSPDEWGLDEKTAELVKHAAEIKAHQPQSDYQTLILEHQSEFGLSIIKTETDPLPQFVRYGIYITANALRRIWLLEAAMPFGLKIYGNDDWLVLLKDNPLRDCYAGPADPERDVPNIFASSQINLNIHSLQALTSLNQRDFNCPVSGGFLLTDWVEGADDFFIPNEEMVFYNDRHDLQNKLQYYLEHSEERQEIINKGRARVLYEHTYAARAPKVLETLKNRITQRYTTHQ